MPTLLLLAGCVEGEAEPQTPPADPCVALRAQIDLVHASHPCSADSECELAPGILRPGIETRAARPRYGMEGMERTASPCGTAIHRERRTELDALLDQWRLGGCGPVSSAGSTACETTSHGARATCVEGRCAMTM